MPVDGYVFVMVGADHGLVIPLRNDPDGTKRRFIEAIDATSAEPPAELACVRQFVYSNGQYVHSP